MRLGLIARADATGLGYQTKLYYKHLKPHKTMLVDISNLNGNKQFYGWYQDANIIKGIPDKSQIRNFLNDIDVLLVAESPYNYELYRIARAKGIKICVVYNYEFFDWFTHPDYPKPDLLIAPSMWNFDIIDKWAKEHNVAHVYLHHPVDRQDFPYRKRVTKKALHIAGKPAAHDRNGTWQYLQANPTGKVVTQSEDFARQLRKRYRQSNVFTGIADPNELYNMGDFLVFPRRYGGNCLPLNEALSTGMPVIMPDISPNNVLLPKDWLVPATVTEKFKPRTEVDIYSCDPDALRAKIEWFKSCDIERESETANIIADSISWETLKPRWIEELER